MDMNGFLRRAALFLLVAMLAGQPILALAQSDGASETSASADDTRFIAIATVALKVRREAGKEHRGVDSIPKDAMVYIVELGDEWCKVRTASEVGYVQTKYLDRIREYDPVSGNAGQAAEPPNEGEEKNNAFESDKTTFQEKYFAHAVKKAGIHLEADERSRRIESVPMYDRVYVSEILGDWCYARYGQVYGYMRCDSLFKWDRVDPYAGPIPGLTVYPLMVFVNRTTNIYSAKDNTVLKTVNPGSALCVKELDENGRYPLPYWRTQGYILAEDVAWVMPVVAYDEAQPGDLISVMTTYYAVGISSLQYQGRNWNIYLSSSMISGTVLQPGESYDQNETIGPYRKSTGYHKAPIMSPNALWGYGGGTCQVNTTFYMSLIQIPLLITHRKVHAEVGIYYCDKGFDAAVGGGDINLRMTNTLPYAIRYQFFISDGVLTCCIFRES